jgi:NTE family protein
VLVVLSTCQSTDYPNSPLSASTFNEELPVSVLDGPDDPLILMAFSGGGSRAAGLSYAILQQLGSLSYQRGNNSASLLDRVKVIAAVSGGSVTAAYFGAATPREFALFSSKFLEKDNMTSLEWEAANPLLGFVWRCNDVRALTCSGSCLIKGSLRAGPLPTLINRESLLSL